MVQSKSPGLQLPGLTSHPTLNSSSASLGHHIEQKHFLFGELSDSALKHCRLPSCPAVVSHPA